MKNHPITWELISEKSCLGFWVGFYSYHAYRTKCQNVPNKNGNDKVMVWIKKMLF